MSKTLQTRCDGCFRTDHEIAQSRPKYPELENDGETIDICVHCNRKGHYICSRCRTVHRCKKSCPYEILHHDIEIAEDLA